jgi:hypothetical protein
MECTEAVAAGMVGDAMREIGAHVVHAELIDEKLAELVDARQ